MANKIYWWERPTDYLSQDNQAEVQIGSNGFNMSFVIDGTKDSAKMVVLSYKKKETIKPYSIVLHEDTNTWWIVANDKVEHYVNDDGDYLYKHNLQLEGAIELLNARDLTDCGFNQGRYTITNFVDRLFALSNYELGHSISFGTNLSGNKIVDYIKTYENYTLLSALRDFFDGYNCAVKLSFI